MSRVRGLELLFNLEKKNLKSKEDCVVAVFHCLLINEGLQCVGVGDEWPEHFSTTELLPSDWNSNQNVYSLRYISKDQKSRILLKATKMEHMLQVDVVLNEDAVASMSVAVADHISDDFSDYSTTYKDLNSLAESFAKNIMQNLQPKKEKPSSSTQTQPKQAPENNSNPPQRVPVDLREDRGWHPSSFQPRYPRVGGSDLDPFGGGVGGGMFMDPSSFGIPSRPTMPPHFSGLPHGSVPPGARFDPFMPPMRPGRFQPDPDHMRPPDFEDNFYM